MKLSTPALLAFAFGVTLPTVVSAGTRVFPGATCNPALLDTAQDSSFYRNESGFTNTNTGSARWVTCPVFDDSSVSEALKVYYNDGSSAANLKCMGYVRQPGASVTWSPPLFSCGTVGGCTSNSDPGYSSTSTMYLAFTGSNYDGAVCNVGQAVNSSSQICIQTIVQTF
jgi:hypothetical protein